MWGKWVPHHRRWRSSDHDLSWIHHWWTTNAVGPRWTIFCESEASQKEDSISALKSDCSVPVSFQNIALETDALSDLPAFFHQNFRIDRDPYLIYHLLLPFAFFCQTRNSSLSASSKANKAPKFKLFSHFFSVHLTEDLKRLYFSWKPRLSFGRMIVLEKTQTEKLQQDNLGFMNFVIWRWKCILNFKALLFSLLALWVFEY